MNIFVGNLKPEVTEDDLRPLFEAHGQVSSVQVIRNRDTGLCKGFGFVEMPDRGQALAAINALNLQPCKGRAMTVNEARPREERGGGGRFGGGGRRDRY